MRWIIMALALAHGMVVAAAEEPAASNALVIERQEPLEGGDGVRLTLRNISNRTITAWSILYEAGTPAALVTHASSSRDAYHRLPFQEDGEEIPLAPGQVATQEIRIPGVDLSPNRFETGNYAVFSGRVSAVFFDDGQVVGDEQDLIERFIARRVAEVTATILLREHLIELEATHGDGQELLAAVNGMVAEERARNPRRTPIEMTADEKAGRPSRGPEQLAWGFALQHANYFSAMAKQVGSRGAFAQTLSRLDAAIANGLRNLPIADREALQ